VGIIDNIERGEAAVLATGLIISAARRVIEKQSSVPKPWLGISGEPINVVTTSSLVNKGWDESEATALTQERHGILLTSVAPDSPASMAALRPGDVILRMNGEDIRNADDFSWQLEQAGPGAAVTFTVKHPGQDGSESVSLKLSGSFFPGLAAKIWAKSTPHWKNTFFEKHGIETISLTPGVALSLGASEGLLVFSVEPDSDAFKAGLRPGDVIERINGKRVIPGSAADPGTSIKLSVVRRKQKLTFTFENQPQ
jgi:serine protease Do